MMRKLMMFIAAFPMLVACVKENSVNVETIDASKLVFNITVNRLDEPSTKGVKTSWVANDKIYLFFEDNTTGYARMTYDGSSWSTVVTNAPTVSASGKKLTAVYVPYNTDEPVYSEGWTFDESYAYYLSAEAVEYTVDTSDIPATLSATINMTAPAGFVQFFIPDESAVAGTYMLTASYIAPASCGAITPGGAVAQTIKSDGYAMPGIVATVAEEKGYYFYGILNAAKRGVATSYLFQLVTQEPTKGYAISSRTKTVNGTLDPTTVGAAIKFNLPSGWTASLPCVDLGFSHIKWATGNVQGDTQNLGSIANPLEAGGYYSWMRTSNDGSTEGGTDTATWLLGAPWRMPTVEEFNALANTTDNTIWSHKTGWTTIGSNTGGFLVTSKVNGLSIFLPASAGEDERGNYWSSESGKCFFVQGVGYIYDTANVWGFSVRPVKEVLAISNLVHYWPFNGNLNDAVPSGAINGTFLYDGETHDATLTEDRHGNANSAYSFDGYNIVSIGHAGDFGTSSFTANMWICTTATTYFNTLIRTEGSSGGNGWFIRFKDSDIEIWASGNQYVSNTKINDGIWHMITFVHDTNNKVGQLYVDGVYKGGYTMSSVPNVSSDGVHTHVLGSGTHYRHCVYDGKMDEVRLYDKALTAAEVAALYQY